MSYKIYDISKKQETSLDLKNCTITGNSSAYTIKDGSITKYSILDGKIDKNSGEKVERIELTNYQLALFDFLKTRDDNPDILDSNDLKNLSPETLQSKINNVYKEKNIYNVVSAKINQTSAELNIVDSKKLDKKIAIEFEKEEKVQKEQKPEQPGLLKKSWNSICKFFNNVGRFFGNLFSSKEEKIDETIEVPLEDERTETEPAQTLTIGDNDEHNPIVLCNQLGISYSLLKLANPHLDLNKPLQNGAQLNIPTRKIVIPGSVTNIAETAEAAGVSKEYVEDILFKIEGLNGIAAKVPYDDIKERLDKNGYPVPIKGRENKKNGALTIGYGHTGRVFGQVMTRQNRESIKISQEQAYELLAADIISAKADAEAYFGTAFNEAPQSIQDAIVDIIFNKGLEKGIGLTQFKNCKKQTLTPQIKKCLEEKDYTKCISKLIYETPLKGLHKRNYYRLISSMRDLSAEEIALAMKDIESYYNKVCTLYQANKSELKHIQNAWNNAKNGICSGFMN